MNASQGLLHREQFQRAFKRSLWLFTMKMGVVDMITFKVPYRSDTDQPIIMEVGGTAYSIEIGKEPFYFVTHSTGENGFTRVTHFNSGRILIRDLSEWSGKDETQQVERAVRSRVKKVGVKKFKEFVSSVEVINPGVPLNWIVASIADEPKAKAAAPDPVEDVLLHCVACKGTGKGGKSAFGGERERDCDCCSGLGVYRHAGKAELDRILALIVSQQGKTKGRLKSSWQWSKEPKEHGFDRVTFNRAYYVWRWARFHGGEDVTMPWTAGWRAGGDPNQKTLDRWSEIVAKRAFGSDMVGARRWHDAFYGASS